MNANLHFIARKLCPESYFIHLLLAEKRCSFDTEFLEPHDFPEECYACSPYGVLPILSGDENYWVGWQAILGYLYDQETEHSTLLKSADEGQRGKVRYICQLYSQDFVRDVGYPLYHEKIGRRYHHRSEPDANTILAARTNLRKSYLPFLERHFQSHHYMVGEDFSMADLMVAAQLCCLDYQGEIPWAEYTDVAIWYQRMKSRQSFAVLLKQQLKKVYPAKQFAVLD